MTNNLIELDGQRVSLKGEMVSLTGLWKAAGSDPSKQPAKWRELPSTKEFASHIADVVLRKSEDEIFTVARGRNAQTFAHWQIMSYARYLDPAFAVRCNEIVRQHMEHRLPAHTDFPSELVEMIKRTDGIVRMLAKKVTKIEHVAAFTITVEPKKRSAA
ncbi:KilA-N domain protein [Aminobacter sp. MSH1]|uniref:KilA-N domain-containing protein n=1 Tax=Aminobacter sp. MSH1 TaxID=374606 RepID=UPI000D35F217|nr:KilA-N domain-containing protein [Aminobacter sp. MSH1]AWC25484.1 KilA-N domain protein [Aminobacter sp. MSH1]